MRSVCPLVIALIAVGACGDSTGPDNDELCTVSMTAGTIAVGQTRTQSLGTADCTLPNESRGDGWQLTLGSATVVQLDLRSDDFDAVIFVTDMDFNIVAAGDDTGGSSDTSLIVPLDAGTYVVWATSFDGDLGDYELEAAQALVPVCPTPTGTIGIGETINRNLEATDCELPNGNLAERWELTTAAATTVRIDMNSVAFDTYLFLSNAAGAFIAGDDDGGDGFNSRIDITLDPGTYVVWASSFDVSVGDFQLSVTNTGTAAGPGARPDDASPGDAREKALSWSTKPLRTR